MRKQNPVQDTAFPRWLTYGLVAILVVFFGIGLKVVFAAFENPGCDPTVDPGSCNLDKPIFVNTTTPDTAQALQTPLTIGSSATARQLSLFGKMVLSKDNENIQTVSGYNGIPINVNSANEHAIYGTANASGKYALYGVGASAASGVFASTVNGNALYASVTGTGTGLLIDAAGKQALTINGNSTFTGTSTFTGDATITGSLEVGSITVGGQSLTGNEGILTGTVTAGGTANFNLKSLVFGGGTNNYTLTSLTVMYSQQVVAGQTRTWQVLPVDKASYKECDTTNYDSTLTITNPLPGNAINVRIKAGFSEDLVVCTGDTTGPTVNFTSSADFNPYFYNSDYSKAFTWTTQSGTASTIHASAVDTESGIAQIKIEVPGGTLQCGPSQTNCTASGTECTCTVDDCTCTWTTPSTTSVQNVIATATNGSGMSANKSNAIYIDYQAPTIVDINMPGSSPTTIYSQYNLILYADDSIDGSGIKSETTKFYLCSSNPCLENPANILTYYGTPDTFGHPNGSNFYNLHFNTLSKSNGTYYLTAFAEDQTGRKTQALAQRTIVINNPTPASCTNVVGSSTPNPCGTVGNVPSTSCCSNSITLLPSCYNPISQCCDHGLVKPMGSCGGGGL